MGRSKLSLWRRVWSFFNGRDADDARLCRRPPLGVEGLEDRWVPSPTVFVAGPNTAVRTLDQTFTFSASSPDPDVQAAGYTYTINWGDGTANNPDIETINPSAGNGGGVNDPHIYAQNGSYTISATATDENSAVSSPATLDVAVSAAGFLTDANIDPNNLYVVPVADGAAVELSAGNNAGDVSVSLTEGGGSPFQQTYSGSDAVIIQPGGGQGDQFQVDAGIAQPIAVQQGNGSGNTSLTINNAGGSDATLTNGTVTLNDASITFDSSVSSLTVTGNATVGNASVGGGSDGVTGPAALTVDGSTQINASSVSTTGIQNYVGAVTLNQDSTLSASAVTFGSTVDGSQNLAVNGDATFGDDVGDNTALASLTVSGNSTIGGILSTSGTQTYTGAVTLGGDVTLTASAVTFGSTVDGGPNLTVNSAATFDGDVGDDAELASLSVSGASAMDTGAVSTSDTQTYTGAVTLGQDVTLTASAVTFGGTLDGAQNLAVNADATFDGEVGVNTLLTSLSVSGASTIDTDVLNTANTQTYDGAVTLGQDTTLTTGTVTFDSTVDGGYNLTVSSDATFGGDVGDNAELASLSVSGATTINTIALSTSGTQTYSGAVTLTADSTLTASAVTFGSTVDGSQNLVVSGDATFDGDVGDDTELSSLSVSGATTIDTSAISTTNAQSYGDAVTLTADTTLTASAVTFSSTVDGAQALLISGDAEFDGAVGSGTALTSLEVDGTTTINAASVTTTGTQFYTDSVLLDADSSLTASAVTFSSTVDGAQNLTVSGDAEFDGEVGSGTTLTSLSVSGATTVNTDALTTDGTQSYGNVTLEQDTTLTASDVTFNGTVDGADMLTISGAGTFDGDVGDSAAPSSLAVSGATTLNLSSLATSGTQDYGGSVTLGNDATLTATVVTFDGTIGGAHNLTVSGAAVFNASVDSKATLGGLSVTGASTINAAALTTTGTQTYDGTTILSQDTTLTASAVTFSSTLDGGQNLTISGAATFDDDVGDNSELTSLAVSGATMIDTDALSTSGTQTFSGAVTLGDDLTLDASVVNFGGTVDGPYDLDLTGTATTTFGGAVGATTALNSLTTDGAGTTAIDGGGVTTSGDQTYNNAVTIGTSDATLFAADVTFATTVSGLGLTVDSTTTATFDGAVTTSSLTIGATDTTYLNGGTVTTSGDQSYGDDVQLGADTTLTSTGSGAIAFASTVDGGYSLTVNTGGTASFAGAVGGGTALTSLTTGSGGSVSLQDVTTSGAQTYNNAVTLDGTYTTTDSAFTITSGATTLAGDSTISTGSGNISFGGTVDGRFGLTLLDSGTTTFGGAVGATTALASLTTDAAGTTAIDGGAVTTSGDQTYNNAVTFGTQDATLSAADVTFATTISGLGLTVNGTAYLNGGTVTTNGSQTFGGPVVLGTDTTFTANGVTFNDTVDGAYNLTVTGAAAFNGNVGLGTALSSLSVSGTTTLGAAFLTTSGIQTYSGAVTLTADSTLTASAIAFNSTVDGGQNLTVSGPVTFNGDIGDTAALSSLTVTDTATINTAALTTSGSQSFAAAVTLTQDATLTGSVVTFDSTVDGAQNLTISGAATFDDNVGSGTALSSLAVTGASTLSAASFTTTGTQSYSGAVTLTQDATLTASAVTFNSTVDGASNLAIGGPAAFNGNVGSGTALTSLAVSGASTIGAASLSTTGAQTYTGAVTLTQDAVLAASAVTFSSTVDGAQNLTLNAATTFNSNVGSGTALTSLTVNGATTLTHDVILNADAVTFNGTVTGSAYNLTVNTTGAAAFSTGVNVLTLTTGASGSVSLNNVTTSGAQTYNNAVTLDGTYTTTDSAFTVANGATTLAGDSTVSTGSGTVTFGGSVIGGYNFTVNSSAATTFDGAVTTGSVTTDAGGTTTINGGSVTTSGSQTYNDAVTIGTQAATLSGTNVTFATTVTGLGLSVGSTGANTFDAAVTTSSLSTSAGGSTDLNGGTVTTAGGQTYGNPVVLGVNTTLTSTGAGAITLASTLDGAFSLNANTGGATTFGGAVGATTALTSLTTGLAGSVSLQSVTTTGTQTYNNPNVTLAGTFTITNSTFTITSGATTLGGNSTVSTGSGNINFGGTIDGAFGLTANTSGTVFFAQMIGGITPVGSLTTTGGGTTINDGAITTSGNQSYDTTTIATSAATLSGANVTFTSTVTGLGLTVNSPGVAAFDGAATTANLTTTGGSTAINGGTITTPGNQGYDATTIGTSAATLTAPNVTFTSTVTGLGLTVNTTAAATFAGTVTIASLTTGTTGSVSLQSAQTAGAQTYNNPTVTLDGDYTTTNSPFVVTSGATTLAGDSTVSTGSGNVTFGGTIDGAYALTIESSGTITFAYAVGSTTALTALTTAGGTADINGGSMTTTGDQDYNDNVVLGVVTNFNAGGSLNFGGSVTQSSGSNGISIVGGPDTQEINLSGATVPVTLEIRAASSNYNPTLIGGQGTNHFIKTATEHVNETIVGGRAGSTNDYQVVPNSAVTLVSQGGTNVVDLSAAGIPFLDKDGNSQIIGVDVDLSQTDGQQQLVYQQALTNPDIGSLVDPSLLTTTNDASLALQGAFQTVYVGSGATLYAAPSTFDPATGQTVPGSTIYLFGTGDTVYGAPGATILGETGGDNVIQNFNATTTNAFLAGGAQTYYNANPTVVPTLFGNSSNQNLLFETTAVQQTLIDNSTVQDVLASNAIVQNTLLGNSNDQNLLLGNSHVQNVLLGNSGVQGLLLGNPGVQGLLLGNPGVQGLLLGNSGVQGLLLGNAGVQGLLLGNPGVQGLLLGNPGVQGLLLGNPGVQGLLLGNPGVQGLLLGNPGVQGLLLGNPGVQSILLGNSQVQSILLGNSQVQSILLGNSQVQGILLGNANVQSILLGNAQVQSILLGNAQVQHLLLSNPTVQALLVGNTTIQQLMLSNPTVQGLLLGSSAVQNLLFGSSTVQNLLFGNATVGGLLLGNATVAGILFGNATVGGLLLGNSTVTNLLFGNSTVQGLLFGNSGVGSLLLGNSTITSILFGSPTVANLLLGNPTVTGLLFGSPVVQNLLLTNAAVQSLLLSDPTVQSLLLGNATVRNILFNNPKVVQLIFSSAPTVELLLGDSAVQQLIVTTPALLQLFFGNPAVQQELLLSPGVLQLIIGEPAVLDSFFANNPTVLETFLTNNPGLEQQLLSAAGLGEVRLNVTLAGTGNSASGGLLSTFDLGSGGLFTEDLTASELFLLNQAAADSISLKNFQLNVTADGGNNVFVGGAMSNFTANGGGNNRFVIEDPSLIGVGPGSTLPSAISAFGGTFTGSGGNDTFYFVGGNAGYNFGNVTLNEPSTASPTETLDFSNYTGGGVSVSLATTAAQSATPGVMTLTLNNAASILNVIGSPGADSIAGNALNNVIEGSALDPTDPFALAAVPPSLPPTQWVYLDFNDPNNIKNMAPGEYISQSDPNGLVSGADQKAILQGLQTIYTPFNNLTLNGQTYNLIQFTTSLSAIPTGTPYETVNFNWTPTVNGVPSPGGESNEIDFRNLNQNTSMIVDINGFLGAGVGLVPDTEADFDNLSVTVIAHELGHTLGLRHEDALGPIGFGISNPPGINEYFPAYPGLIGAFTTDQHVITSPAAVGSTLADAADGEAQFGDREAISLAFIYDGTVVDGTNAALTGALLSGKNTVTNLSSITNLFVGEPFTGPGVPVGTTIATIGSNSITLSNNATLSGAQTFTTTDDGPFAVAAAATQQTKNVYVVNETELTSTTSTTILPQTIAAQPLSLYSLAVPNPIASGFDAGQALDVDAVDVLGKLSATGPDFYTFQGTTGDLMNFETKSAALTRVTDSFDTVLYVYAPELVNGKLSYVEVAWNDDQFEPSDSSIVDFTLPTTGTYLVEVDSYQHATGQAGVSGDYELFVYRYAAFNATSGNDTLVAGTGNDTLLGGTGNTTFVLNANATGTNIITGGTGNNTLQATDGNGFTLTGTQLTGQGGSASFTNITNVNLTDTGASHTFTINSSFTGNLTVNDSGTDSLNTTGNGSLDTISTSVVGGLLNVNVNGSLLSPFQVTNGNIGTFNVTNSIQGAISATGNLNSLIVGQNVGSTVAVTGTLGTVAIGGGVTNTGVIQAGSITTMTVGLAATGLSSIPNVNHDLAGRIIVNGTGTLGSLRLAAGAPGTIAAGHIGSIGLVAGYGPVVLQVYENGVERHIEAALTSNPFPSTGLAVVPSGTPTPTPSGVTFGIFYEGTATLTNPQATIRVTNSNTTVTPDTYDLSLVTYNDTAKFNLARLDATSAGSGIRNVSVEGDLLTAVSSAANTYLNDTTAAGVQLPNDALGSVAIRDYAPNGDIKAKSLQAVAFGSDTHGSTLQTGWAASATDAANLLASGTAIVQANSTFRVPFADLSTQQVAFFFDSNPSGGAFDANPLKFTVQANVGTPSNAARGAVVALITAAPTVVNGKNSTGVVQTVALRGDGASITTAQAISTSITSGGSMGDINLTAQLPPLISAASIFGSINQTVGTFSGTVKTTGQRTDPITGAVTTVQGDFGTVLANGTVTTVNASSGLTGTIGAAGNLVSLVTINGAFTGTIQAVGNLGTVGLDSSGTNSPLHYAWNSSNQLTVTGGVSISGTTSAASTISAGGNLFGPITVSGAAAGTVSAGGDLVGLLNFKSTFSGAVNVTGNLGAIEYASSSGSAVPTNYLWNASNQLVTYGGVNVGSTDSGALNVGANVYGTITLGGGLSGSVGYKTTNSVNVGTNSGGMVIVLGNQIGNFTVNGTLAGLVAVQGDVGGLELTSAGKAVVSSTNTLTRYGAFTVNGTLSGAVAVLGNMFSNFNVSGGTLSGRVAVQGRGEYGLDGTLTTASGTVENYTSTNARIGMLGQVTISGPLTGALISGGVIGDNGYEYNQAMAAGTTSTGTQFSVSGSNTGIIAAAQHVNGASNLVGTKGFFTDLLYQSATNKTAATNLAAVDNVFSNGVKGGLTLNGTYNGYSGLVLLLGELEGLTNTNGTLAG